MRDRQDGRQATVAHELQRRRDVRLRVAIDIQMIHGFAHEGVRRGNADSGREASGSSGSRVPEPRASASSARTCSTLATIVCAWRAAMGPIETWSSWFALVGIESTDAGWASDLFSDTSAAATYW